MSTSKKSKSTSAKSPAPATKSTAPKPAAKKKTAAVPARRSSSKAPLTAAALKSVATKPVRTTICARVDVGFGNVLSIRGEGAGLSWEVGTTMECVEGDVWQVVLPESARGHVFKFLVNDLSWSTGPDYTVANGASVTLTPEF